MLFKHVLGKKTKTKKKTLKGTDYVHFQLHIFIFGLN